MECDLNSGSLFFKCSKTYDLSQAALNSTRWKGTVGCVKDVFFFFLEALRARLLARNQIFSA